VKAKSWEDRMDKSKKELAIKKLQTELKEEKQAEITRYVETYSNS
jgi:rRNA-processing protein CGR1